MNLRTLLLMLVFSVSISAFSQDIDVTKLLADTKTFIFDNNKNTVKGFIYSELEAKTSCCGSDRIYLEVKIDPSGYVVQAKTLTGKNDCFKQSAADIVKNVKWNAADFKGPKSVYFEIKPDVECQDGKDNTYKQIAVTNNKLLDANGNRIPGTGFTAPQVVENTPSESPATETPVNTTPAETKTDPVKVEEKDETKVATNETTPPAENASEAGKVEEKTEPVTQTPPPTQVADNQVTPQNDKEEATPQVVPQNTTSSDQLQQAKTMAEAYRAVQDSEIEALKEQMAQKKAEREAEIKKEERRLAIREKRRQEIIRRREAAKQQAESEDDLFAFDTDDNNSGNDTEFGYDNDVVDQEKTEEDRLTEELERLRQEREQMEQGLRDTDDQRRQATRDGERQAQDLLRLEEEIQRIQEDQERLREQKEIDRLNEEQRRIEDEKRERQDELQRLMDEIERLRNEADQRLADLEQQEEDLKRVDQEKTLREQEIEADRIARQQEQIAALRLRELELQANSAGGDPSAITSNPDVASAIAEAMGVTDDSTDRYLPLIRTIAQLEAEIKRLQIEMNNLQQSGTPSSTDTEVASSSTPTTTPYKSTTLPENAGTLAAQDKSWEGIEYKDPNADDKIYRSVPKQQKPAPNQGTGLDNESARGADNQSVETTENKVVVPDYQEGRGYSPASSHKDTHANVEGPQFSNLEYGEGRDAMKKYITDKLKTGGVCGLAQTFAEVTVNPNGDVVGYKVLKANSALVEALLPPILQSLKFNKTELRFNQNSYIEFKADISCTEQEKLDLKKVKDYVDKEVTSN